MRFHDYIYIYIYIYIYGFQNISAPSSLCFNRTHWKKGLKKGQQRASYEQIKHPIELLDLVSSNSDSFPNWNIPNGSKPMVHSSSLWYHIWIYVGFLVILVQQLRWFHVLDRLDPMINNPQQGPPNKNNPHWGYHISTSTCSNMFSSVDPNLSRVHPPFLAGYSWLNMWNPTWLCLKKTDVLNLAVVMAKMMIRYPIWVTQI